jgi:hypothetical protein
MNFFTGQKVVCVESRSNNRGTRIVAGNIYTVLDLFNCPWCGVLSLDVGLRGGGPAAFTECAQCEFKKPYDGRTFARAMFFAPLESYGDHVTERIAEEVEQEKLVTA